MAEITKANGIGDWFDQRLATKKLAKVMMTEYWMGMKAIYLARLMM